MNTPTLDALTQRLDRLERELRPWKIFGVSALLISGLAVITAAAAGGCVRMAHEVSARRFIVVDEDGRPRGEFGLSADGSARLTIAHRNREVRIVLRVDVDGWPALQLGGKGDALIRVDANGPVLAFQDAEKTNRAPARSGSGRE